MWNIPATIFTGSHVSLLIVFFPILCSIPSSCELSKLMSCFYIFWANLGGTKVARGWWDAGCMVNLTRDFSAWAVHWWDLWVLCLGHGNFLQVPRRASSPGANWEHPPNSTETPLSLPDQDAHQGTTAVRCGEKGLQIAKDTNTYNCSWRCLNDNDVPRVQWTEVKL